MSRSSPVVVVAGVIRNPRDRQVLISHRPAGTHLGDLWEFPGGKVETGESLEEALRRELREEVGVDVTVGALLDEVVHAYEEQRVHLYFFECTIIRGHPDCRARDIRWCALDELGDYPMPEANSHLIRTLQSTSGP